MRKNFRRIALMSIKKPPLVSPYPPVGGVGRTFPEKREGNLPSEKARLKSLCHFSSPDYCLSGLVSRTLLVRDFSVTGTPGYP
jgi:hypothetical protein